jgi:tRNA (uracil-5-)-methyltransferase TRM9
LDRTTAGRLNAINLAFYRECADEFSAAREEPWPGWARLPDLLRARGIDAELDVLDVGCGNGRFGAFLCAQACPPRRYVGIDASAELLAHARARALPGASFALADLVAGDPETALPADAFALVALFGVLHHVPGRERRRALVEALARRVGRGGLLVLAAWQRSGADHRRDRIVAWEAWNRSAPEPVDPAELEPGDCLLAWGSARQALRYCHFSDDAELDALLADLPCAVIASWRADGHEGCQNRYFALEPR